MPTPVCHYVTGYALPDMADFLSFPTFETPLKIIHHFIH
jgi:hypothetical protein